MGAEVGTRPGAGSGPGAGAATVMRFEGGGAGLRIGLGLLGLRPSSGGTWTKACARGGRGSEEGKPPPHRPAPLPASVSDPPATGAPRPEPTPTPHNPGPLPVSAGPDPPTTPFLPLTQAAWLPTRWPWWPS